MRKTDPLFSILIAQYNNGRYFADCYQSIIAQTYSNWEVIIVDDCSTDHSVAQMKKLIGEDLRFKLYLNAENKGCGFTKRRLAELATGEICGFLDPDDTITPNALEVMVLKHLDSPDAVLVYSNCNICDQFMGLIDRRKVEQVVNGDISFLNKGVNIFHFTSFRYESYRNTEGIDSYLKRAVDQDLYLKLYEKGPVIHANEYVYNYRIHNRGLSTLGNSEKASFWYWVVVIAAARRRKINIEKYFVDEVIVGERQILLEKEIASYNRSFIFKVLRKLSFFKI